MRDENLFIYKTQWWGCMYITLRNHINQLTGVLILLKESWLGVGVCKPNGGNIKFSS